MGKYDETKREVLQASQLLSERGYFGTQSGSAGNVSVLIEGEDVVVVTPHGIPYAGMTADDICIVDLDLAPIEGVHDPSVEAPLHVAVYKNRRDVNAVVHSHQPYASIFSILNQPIPPLFDEVTVAIGAMVEVVPYGVSGSPQLLENVVGKLDNRCHCYLLQNHGALCVGRNLEKAFNYVELLEKTAAVYYRALATGRPVTTLPDPLPEVLFGFVKREQDAEIARKEGRQPSE
jgi:L-fuculose-phosphate aldolase